MHTGCGTKEKDAALSTAPTRPFFGRTKWAAPRASAAGCPAPRHRVSLQLQSGFAIGIAAVSHLCDGGLGQRKVVPLTGVGQDIEEAADLTENMIVPRNSKSGNRLIHNSRGSMLSLSSG